MHGISGTVPTTTVFRSRARPLSLFLPLILFLEFLFIFAISLSLASLNLKYADFYQIWDIALQLGFFLSSIVYDENLVPLRFKFSYSLNPVTALIESARSVLLTKSLPSDGDLTIIGLATLILFAIGLVIFRKLEWQFAEEM